MKKLVLRGLLVIALCGVIGVLSGAIWYREHVVQEPGEHLSRASIESVIAQESPVLYADGRTRIGVFFSREHRDHVPFAEIPEAWIQAITATVDKRYWDHVGVDVFGIARAMVTNVLAGRVVAGGSTLTQQTAKNLYYRPDRSLRSKLEELVNALRLEAHYSKEEILEFYANQFHVSANGRGLGIAARYFFDRDVAELGVQECAFLAGLVKAPARYNPFVGGSEETRAKAMKKGQDRTAYVLSRMVDEGFLTSEKEKELANKPLPFKKGVFRYSSSVMLDEVERRLALPPFPDLFEQAGIGNPSTAGIEVVTTLDERVQRAARYGLVHHLTEVGPLVEGLAVESLLLDESWAPKPDPNNPPQLREIRLATVVGPWEKGGLSLDLGGFAGRLDRAGVQRMTKVLAQGEEGNRWAKPSADELAQLERVLVPGAVVRVSVRALAEEDTPILLDLEFYPELQGAVLVLESGQIRGMVGGSSNRDFNRALSAKRQLGSTWKPLVVHAALQLGWTPTDTLDNRRNVFPFEGMFYAPNPDHEPEPVVSLAWASVRSENLASIWLLHHLVDRLEDGHLLEVARLTGLAPGPGEGRQDYIRRIRDDLGVIATQERLDAGHFSRVRREVAADVVFSGVENVEQEIRELASLHYGMGFTRERKRLDAMPNGPEKTRRLSGLELEFLFLEDKAKACRADYYRLRRVPGGGDALYCGKAPQGALPYIPDPEGPPGDFLVEGRLHLSTLLALREAMDRQVDPEDAYALDALIHHPDFRVLLGVKYVAALATRLGVESKIPPVLSLPLGAVDVSLEEMVGVYEGFLTGERWLFPGQAFDAGSVSGLRTARPVDAGADGHLLIQEVRDRHGNVLYRAAPAVQEAFSPREGALVADMLSNVVSHGTARRVARSLEALSVGGKTGTTNGYRNAAFLGFAQGSKRYHLGTYVGYDDNRKMVRGNTRLAGSSGALPAWGSTVEGLVELGVLAPEKQADLVPLVALPVNVFSGMPMAEGAATVRIHAPTGEASRRFAPFEGEDDAPVRAPATGLLEGSIWDEIEPVEQ